MTERHSVGGAKLVFVGGIHGVGKSFLCTQLAEKLAATHRVAGDLLKEARQQALGPDKRVFDVAKNQDVLVEALEMTLRPGEKSLLDGHFVLVNGRMEIEEIPLRTFQAINPLGVVLVTDDPRKVAERLRERDGRFFESKFLDELQSRELAHASAICAALDIPFLRASQESLADHAVELNRILSWLERILGPQ